MPVAVGLPLHGGLYAVGLGCAVPAVLAAVVPGGGGIFAAWQAVEAGLRWLGQGADIGVEQAAPALRLVKRMRGQRTVGGKQIAAYQGVAADGGFGKAECFQAAAAGRGSGKAALLQDFCGFVGQPVLRVQADHAFRLPAAAVVFAAQFDVAEPAVEFDDKVESAALLPAVW